MQPPSPASRALVAIAAALALADASIVALALPPILAEMHTTVTGVAAIVGVYAFVLAAAILPAERLVRRDGPSAAGGGGVVGFAAGAGGGGGAGALRAPALVLGGPGGRGGPGPVARVRHPPPGPPGARPP